jgi:hypothetical protein
MDQSISDEAQLGLNIIGPSVVDSSRAMGHTPQEKFMFGMDRRCSLNLQSPGEAQR